MTTTETASPRFIEIDDWPVGDLVEGILEGQFAAIAAARAASPSIARAIEASTIRLRAGGRLIYVGAGTSGRVAAQDAAELPPTFGWPAERAVPVMAGGERALLRSVEGAEDDDEAARAALRDLGVNANDVVVALAASGRTPFAVGALEQARSVGALAIGIFNNSDSRLEKASDIGILLDTGSEFVAGSTRMKAGTAQKAALNCLSTCIMIQLGLVYRGKMVEMRPRNEKLGERAVEMLADFANCDKAMARAALHTAGGSIKLATIMLCKSVPVAKANSLLHQAGGKLREALKPKSESN